MIRHSKLTALIPTLALALAAGGAISFSSMAAADDAPPPAAAPGNDGGGRHHDPAWAGCKKKADDQKLQPGDARRDFMKSCVKDARSAAPAPAAS
jgi:Spy/CpxP family protein refolding chaperone